MLLDLLKAEDLCRGHVRESEDEVIINISIGCLT